MDAAAWTSAIKKAVDDEGGTLPNGWLVQVKRRPTGELFFRLLPRLLFRAVRLNSEVDGLVPRMRMGTSPLSSTAHLPCLHTLANLLLVLCDLQELVTC